VSVRRRFGAALGAVLGATIDAAGAASPPEGAVGRGEYVFNAAGCLGCHTHEKGGGVRLAGGRPLATPFGTFYSPNITPDSEHGIGRWSQDDFMRAMREGVAPGGRHLFPAFPYASYTWMTDGDLADLWAYLRAQPPVAQPDREHDLSPPFSWRFLIPVWKSLYLEKGPLAPDPNRSTAWNRGRYLVQALGHCGECHTPRTLLGGLDRTRPLAGNPDGPDGNPVPNLTPAPKSGLDEWTAGDIALALETGLLPDGDVVGGGMGEVVRNSTSKLIEADRQAIVTYLQALPPIE